MLYLKFQYQCCRTKQQVALRGMSVWMKHTVTNKPESHYRLEQKRVIWWQQPLRVRLMTHRTVCMLGKCSSVLRLQKKICTQDTRLSSLPTGCLFYRFYIRYSTESWQNVPRKKRLSLPQMSQNGFKLETVMHKWISWTWWGKEAERRARGVSQRSEHLPTWTVWGKRHCLAIRVFMK